jgi:hypothetical protein
MGTSERSVNTSEYEINSIEGDEGLSHISLVLHGNSSEEDSHRILQTGMTVQEGRATVSTDLAHAIRWATTAEKRHYSKSPTKREDDEVGRIFVLRIPEGLHLGYGMFTSEKIDDAHKEVKGTPIKYASGRKQPAFYGGEDSEALRRQIEVEHALGSQPRQINLRPDSVAISRTRNLGLDVMRALGYRISKENGETDTKVVEPTAVKRRVQDVYQRSHSEDFHLGPKWLQKYLRVQSEKMLAQVASIN